MLAVFDRALPYLGPGLALVLGIVALGRRSLDVGEAAAVAAAQGSFSDVVERALSDDPARAGYLALLHPVVGWNDAEHWARLPSVAAAVLAAVAAYRLGRRLAGRHAGAAASVLLAASLGVVLLSRTVGPLAFALAAMLLSSALFARAVERGNAVWWAVYAVSAALLPLTHPIAAAALGAQILALVAARREVDLRLAVPGDRRRDRGVRLLPRRRRDRPRGRGGRGGRARARRHRHRGGPGCRLEPRRRGFGDLGRAHARSGARTVLARGSGTRPRRRACGPAARRRPARRHRASRLSANRAHGRRGRHALAAGIGLVSIRDRALRLVCLAAVGASPSPRSGWRRVRSRGRTGGPPRASFEAKTTPRDTVVVLPERARAALAYYAPGVRTTWSAAGRR